ncbi:HAD family hydrolase [Rahnella sp. Lac-M11]|jgi:Cof subfamily protein (haloacid dehalogenase superfamily)|uniref:HAD family hydrolase n=1 Tax=Rahnella contaminans TaxID=2703882 RepID=A0A6M2B6P4_9GAMM|nr:Cof-type HAD-IIB family hydrolase [Rahnella contaminans]NGX88685.1 HAD family hydrolase [Rahnella contaminans]
MAVKLIAVDMDGTFLDQNGEYNKARFRGQYAQMLERGIKFVVASGNQYYQLKSFFDDIDEEIAYVAEGGGYVVDKKQEIYCGKLEPEQVTLVLDWIRRTPGINTIVCGRLGAYVLEGTPEAFISRMRRYYHRLTKVQSYAEISDTIFKFALSYVEDDVYPLMGQITEQLGGIVAPVTSGHGSVDLIIAGNHKASGLRKIQQIYGIRDDEVLAFGDSGNDLEMLSYAGYGFAMENASAPAKAAAKYRAPSHENEGVLEVIDDVFNARPPFA